MKNKAGKISGFILGMAGFLLLFKLIFLVRIPQEDELAPGMVVFASILSGLFFAYAGNLIQDYVIRKSSYH